jgi:hypothetical protein
MAESMEDKQRKAEEARDKAIAEANAKFGEASEEWVEFKDPGGHDSHAAQVGEGQGDEYEGEGEDDGESKSSGSGDQEKVADVKARVGDMSDEELAELADSDDRKGVQDAVAAEQAKRSSDAS